MYRPHIESLLNGKGVDVRNEPLLARLAARFAQVDGPDRISDLAVLLRQALLRELPENDSTDSALSNLAVRVPDSGAFVSHQLWEKYGFTIEPIGDRRLRLTPRLWRPAWLDHLAQDGINAAIREESRRSTRRVPIDPTVAALFPDFDTYACPGQREAVRAACLAPEGSSTLVNLPTGSGKTLAFQFPALSLAQQGTGFALVIVPTVALARDQEARFRDQAQRARIHLPSIPLAYHGGLIGEDKAAVRHELTAGRLPVLFASPEACMASLRPTLTKAASRGLLRLFVVDEAHIVASWGNGFRPEFQAIAGLRNELLEASPSDRRFRTLLLSATITEDSFETLTRLFGHTVGNEHPPRRDVHVVSEVTLRQEPTYIVTQVRDEESRRVRLIEALRFLPRPLLLYVTMREDADRWLEDLKREGYRAVERVMGGDMSTPRGEQILDDWRNGSLDVVVATSAFGLGVDQARVRSVVHACVPESVDRFYQEVGRGGRDGRACVSVLAWTKKDLNVAAGMAREAVITVERGSERWESMRHGPGARELGDVLSVQLDALPSGMTITSAKNRSWNYKTLLGMVTSGFVEFAALPVPAARAPEEDEATYEHRVQSEWTALRNAVAVRILDPGHADIEAWQKRFEGMRQQAHEEQGEAMLGFRRLVSGKEPFHRIFASTYSIRERGISVRATPGDCPVSRACGVASHDAFEPDLVTLRHSAARCREPLNRLFRDGEHRLWVVYDRPTSESEARQLRRTIANILERLSAEGVVAFSAPPDWLGPGDWKRLASVSPLRFIYGEPLTRETRSEGMDVPTVTVLGLDCTRGSFRDAALLDRSRHVLITPGDTRDPVHPYRHIRDRLHYSLDSLLRSLDR